MARTAEGALLALAASLLAGCASAPAPCAKAADCGGATCQVGRCGPIEQVPVALDTRRTVLSADATRTTDGAAYVATLGGDTSSATVLLRFPAAWGRGRVERAYLVLTPAPGAPPSADGVTITVARALEPWTATSSAPRVGPVEARVSAPFAPPRSIRVDVTAAVRDWGRTGEPHHGFVVRASGAGALGASFAMEADEAPRLDVYVRR